MQQQSDEDFDQEDEDQGSIKKVRLLVQTFGQISVVCDSQTQPTPKTHFDVLPQKPSMMSFDDDEEEDEDGDSDIFGDSDKDDDDDEERKVRL